MISRRRFTPTIVLVGVVLAAVVSARYAMAFAAVHPVVTAGAMGVCFLLLTLPMWLALADKPLNNAPAYYLLALAALASPMFGGVPVQAWFHPFVT